VAVGRLSDATTEGAVLGLPGFGESFGWIFYGVWVTLLVFTGVAVWGARRCITIRSIQSATGLYYVALLTAGVSEFLVRYLMVSST
jgi:high-affinity Fe2+/Pb2+ permease